MNNNNMDIKALMSKPMWQMTGEEFCALTKYAMSNDKNIQDIHTEICTGIHALSEQLGCCESTVYMLKREGVLNDAIISQIGKKIVFDIEKARFAADKHMRKRRSANE